MLGRLEPLDLELHSGQHFGRCFFLPICVSIDCKKQEKDKEITGKDKSKSVPRSWKSIGVG